MPTRTAPRIVSLIASSTEIVHALGMSEYMVGRSHECDYPQSIKNLPICTGPKFQTDGSSYEIDQRVKAIVQESLSVYKVYAEVLEELKPSHIITQAQCEVCAVSLKDVEDAACHLISSQPQIVSLQPDCLEDIWTDIGKVAQALTISEQGETLIATLRQRIAKIEKQASEIVSKSNHKPTVAVVEWIEPLMAAGNWMPELVELAGGENLFGIAGKHSPWMEWKELVEKDPDVIIVTPCGFDNERTMKEMHLIAQQPGYDQLKAVKNNRVYVADGNQYFNRPGPRVVESLEMMAEMIHPESFNFGHEGAGWILYKH
ncbi:MAG: cobalamin-binding protein [Candidatus Melainabacteria bacterium]|nr:cobalamin-binding protein [Candidatus Melainabacteria bacterium]